MSERVVVACPVCGTHFPLESALAGSIEARLRDQLEAGFGQRLAAAESLGRETLGAERRLWEAERQRFATAEVSRATEGLNARLSALEEELSDRDKKVQSAREQELALRRKQRELEDQKAELTLEIERRIETERRAIREAADVQAAESWQQRVRANENRMAEQQLQLERALRQVDDLKRRLEQGSQELQGEVAEIALEQELTILFPDDVMQSVPKGMRGADVCHVVKDALGRKAGMIVWERKRTKSWNHAWLAKMRDDLCAVGGDVGVIMTDRLPDDVVAFEYLDGVWVVKPELAAPLATVLRSGLLQVAHHRRAAMGKGEKMELLHTYLIGPEFRQRVESVVGAFAEMRADLEQERRAMTRYWARRAKQLQRVEGGVANIYGDLQGLTGRDLPDIEALGFLEEAEDAATGPGVRGADFVAPERSARRCPR